MDRRSNFGELGCRSELFWNLMILPFPEVIGPKHTMELDWLVARDSKRVLVLFSIEIGCFPALAQGSDGLWHLVAPCCTGVALLDLARI